MTNFDEYQKQAFSTAIYPEKGTGSLFAIMYTALGMGEGGEVQNKVKKVFRDHAGVLTPEMKDSVIKEMGGVLWYLAALSTEIGVTLSEVADKNLEELFSRKNRGTLGGSGDNR